MHVAGTIRVNVITNITVYCYVWLYVMGKCVDICRRGELIGIEITHKYKKEKS